LTDYKCVNSSWQAGGDWSSLCATSLLKMLIHLVSDVNTFCARMAYKQLKLSASNPRRISFLYKCIWRGFFWNLGENKIKEKSVTQLHYKSVFQLRPQLQNNQSLFVFFFGSFTITCYLSKQQLTLQVAEKVVMITL